MLPLHIRCGRLRNAAPVCDRYTPSGHEAVARSRRHAECGTSMTKLTRLPKSTRTTLEGSPAVEDWFDRYLKSFITGSSPHESL